MSAFAARSRAWIASACRSRMLACLGEGDRARAARALDQPEADDALERRDLLGDRGLRVPEPLGRPPERALVGDRLQRDEVSEVEPEPAISFDDRNLASEQVG